MRYTALLFILSLFSFASEYKNIILYYQFENYSKACQTGIKNLDTKNEALLSMIADACAKDNKIDELSKIISYLKSTKEYRQNRSYFTTLLLQKSLILQFIKDDIDLSYLKFPKTTHLISKIFNKIAQKKFSVLIKKPKTIKIDMDDKSYLITVSRNAKDTLVIKEYLGDTLLKTNRIN